LLVRRIVASDGTQLSIGVTARDAAPRARIDDGRCVDMGFPQARRVRTGRGSLHLWRFAALAAAGALSSDLVPLDAGGDFVDDADHACEVHEAVDGTWRCVPKRSVVTEAPYFQDPGCTTRLRLADDASVASSELLLLEYDGTQQARLSGLLALVPYAGQLYGVDQTQCLPVSSVSPLPLLAQDKAIPLTALASLQFVAL
jgi:hypothetical protein